MHHHSHTDHHGHHHSHAAHGSQGFGRAFAIGVILNLGFVAIEAFYGWHTNSLALLADAGHNLSDVGGLLLAWAGLVAGRLKPDVRHTYGWRKLSIMASLGNAVILLLAMGSLAWEAVQRLHTPSPIEAGTVMAVAAIGVVINALTAALFFSGSRHDLNMRGAFLHMAADALVSIGVVLAGALYLWQGWQWIDPTISLLIAVVIVAGTWSLFRQSLHLSFDGVPENIDLQAVRACLQELPGVLQVHDLHVWAMDTTETALTAHLICDNRDSDTLLQTATQKLHEQFSIEHVTLQLESPSFAQSCQLDTDFCSRK